MRRWSLAAVMMLVAAAAAAAAGEVDEPAAAEAAAAAAVSKDDDDVDGCYVVTIFGLKTADCGKQRARSVPSTLDSDLQVQPSFVFIRFSPHRMLSVHRCGLYCYSIYGSVICVSVGHDREPCTKTAEPTEMPFWVWTRR